MYIHAIVAERVSHNFYAFYATGENEKGVYIILYIINKYI